MYDLTDRERQIVFYLYSKPNSTASTIAAIFNVSDKTIRNDIKSINQLVNQPLIISNNYGFYINRNYEDLIADIPLTNNKWNDDAKLLTFLLENERCNLYDLSEKLSISDTTLVNHMQHLKHLVNKYGLTIERKNNDFSLLGHSYQKRQIFIDRILNDAHASLNDLDVLQKYFENINVHQVNNIVEEIIKRSNISIAPFYVSNFVANLCFVLNFDIDDQEQIHGQIDSEVYQFAESLNSKLNKHLSAKTITIYQLLLSMINVNSIDYKEFESNIKQITNDIFKRYHLHINMDNFYPLFIRHVYDMVNRCRNNMPIQSDDGLSIKESCFFIYDIAVSIAKELQLKFSIRITQEEISLISMHIGYLIESSVHQDYNDSKLKIAVLLSNYVQHSLLVERIESVISYPCDITRLQSTSEIRNNNYDLLITTNNIEYNSITHCVISPLFTKTDEMHLQETITQIVKLKRKELLKTLFNVYISPSSFFYEEKTIDKETVIRKLCDSLEEQEIVDSNFLPSVLVREAIATTDINNMYAIPHAMEFIANQTAMCIYINPKGITWNDNTVKIVFLSAFNHNNVSNLRLLYDLIIDTISDNACFSKLIQCKTITDFYRILFDD